jgi:DNA-binding protein HU-beta
MHRTRRANVNKAELVEEIATRTRLPADEVAEVIESFMDIVRRSVTRGEKVVLSGFGTFHRKARARRLARDIWAEEAVVVPATNVPAFRPGKPFKEMVARRRRRSAPTTPPSGGRPRASGGARTSRR